MSLRAGMCITIVGEKSRLPHLFVILTEPVGNPPSAVAVNFTSQKDNSDNTVVLTEGHAFIKKPTVVNYAAARIVNCEALENSIHDINTQTSFHHRERQCSNELLQTLREGLRKSPFTPNKVLEYCKDKF